MRIFLKNVDLNYSTDLEVSKGDLIKEVKERLAYKIIEEKKYCKLFENLENNLQRIKIMCHGKSLKDDKTVDFCKLGDGHSQFIIMPPKKSSEVEVSAKEKVIKLFRKKFTGLELKFLKEQTFTTKQWRKILDLALKK